MDILKFKSQAHDLDYLDWCGASTNKKCLPPRHRAQPVGVRSEEGVERCSNAFSLCRAESEASEPMAKGLSTLAVSDRRAALLGCDPCTESSGEGNWRDESRQAKQANESWQGE